MWEIKILGIMAILHHLKAKTLKISTVNMDIHAKIIIKLMVKAWPDNDWPISRSITFLSVVVKNLLATAGSYLLKVCVCGLLNLFRSNFAL